IITDRDVAVRVLGEGRHPRRTKVGDVMTRDVISCSPEDAWDEALILMEEHQVRRIPAVDASGGVVGIISQGDIALRMHEAAKLAEFVTEMSRPGHVVH